MENKRNKLTWIIVLVIALAASTYFYLQREGQYLQSSLLVGQKLVSESTAKVLMSQGWTCLRDTRYRTSNCQQTKFGESCKLDSKNTSSFVCTTPSNEEILNDQGQRSIADNSFELLEQAEY